MDKRRRGGGACGSDVGHISAALGSDLVSVDGAFLKSAVESIKCRLVSIDVAPLKSGAPFARNAQPCRAGPDINSGRNSKG